MMFLGNATLRIIANDMEMRKESCNGSLGSFTMTARKTFKTTGTLVTFIGIKSQEDTRELFYNINNPTAKLEHSS